jgi:hypothetical protein
MTEELATAFPTFQKVLTHYLLCALVVGMQVARKTTSMLHFYRGTRSHKPTNQQYPQTVPNSAEFGYVTYHGVMCEGHLGAWNPGYRLKKLQIVKHKKVRVVILLIETSD